MNERLLSRIQTRDVGTMAAALRRRDQRATRDRGVGCPRGHPGPLRARTTPLPSDTLALDTLGLEALHIQED
jgi:hypothetical protein